MARVALLSNPRSTGNRSLLPRVRSFCAREKDIFHYEVEHVSQIGAAMRTIARVKPKVLVINGGDGRVRLHWSAEVWRNIGDKGISRDADGYVAPAFLLAMTTEDD